MLKLGDKLKSDRTVLFLVLLIGVAFISFYYGEIAFHLNDKLTSVHGDGIKNYYTYAYHIKHSASFHTFDGMLHPYGDLHIFTDGHTFLAWIIKALAHWFPSISNYSIGFLNFFLIWTPLLTLGALYLLLRSFKQDPFVSAIFALGIMLMAPQFDRLWLALVTALPSDFKAAFSGLHQFFYTHFVFHTSLLGRNGDPLGGFARNHQFLP